MDRKVSISFARVLAVKDCVKTRCRRINDDKCLKQWYCLR